MQEENKNNVLEINLERCLKQEFLNKLEKSKKQYKDGKVYSARTVFKSLRKRYSY